MERFSTIIRVIISQTDLTALLEAKHAAPHAVLGMHPATYRRSEGVVVRAFLRDATECEVVDIEVQPRRSFPLKRMFRLRSAVGRGLMLKRLLKTSAWLLSVSKRACLA